MNVGYAEKTDKLIYAKGVLNIKEIWKAIPGFDNRYEVSNKGNVRSKYFTVPYVNRWGTITEHPFEERNFSLIDNGNGYLYITLRADGQRKNMYVHRLVAAAFIENPQNKPCINHKDYNKKNNNVDNLEWCTQLENVRYSAHLMRKPKTVCQPSNTGHKYISLKKYHKKQAYCVTITAKHVCKYFKVLNDAIAFRNEVM